MNTIVALTQPTDFGVGDETTVILVDTTFTEKDNGTLEVYSKDDGKAAAFPHGTWQGVVRGDIEALNGMQVTR